MNIAVKTLMLIGAAGIGWHAWAAEPPGGTASPRRQLNACMNKQMAASRTLSYNAATALCKARLKGGDATVASATPNPKNAGALGR